MATLKALKAIPNAFKFTVFGYTHLIEKELSISIIPVMIGLFDFGILFSW